jgi:hypothetical protein
LEEAWKKSQTERAGPNQQYRLHKSARGTDSQSTSEGTLVSEMMEPSSSGSEMLTRAGRLEELGNKTGNSTGSQKSMEVGDRVLENTEPSLPIEEDFTFFYMCSPPTSSGENQVTMSDHDRSPGVWKSDHGHDQLPKQ